MLNLIITNKFKLGHNGHRLRCTFYQHRIFGHLITERKIPNEKTKQQTIMNVTVAYFRK